MVKYRIKESESERLELDWKGNYKDFRVKFDGAEIGTVEGGAKVLKAGQQFDLPGGERLTLRLVEKSFAGEELQVLVNGKPLPGSPSHPVERLKSAATMIFFIGGLNLLGGIIILLAATGKWRGISSDELIVIGLIFFALGRFTRRGKGWAIITAFTLVLLNIIGLAFIAVSQGENRYAIAILIQVYFLAGIAKGLGAPRQLKEMNEQ